MANKVATLHIPGKEPIELPILSGTEGPEVIDVRALGSHGYFTYDPGFLSTASCMAKDRHVSMLPWSHVICVITSYSIHYTKLYDLVS